MAWRVLLIQNPAKLTIEHKQFALKNDEGTFTLPLEDILAVILETPQATLSSSLLSACQTNGIVCITCDESHMPNGVLLPFLQHSRASQVGHIQQSWSAPLRKRLWQRIVQTKILNQAACLDMTRGASHSARLKKLSARVSSGDPQNIEAQAARDYWPLLFGKGFHRGQNDLVNAALNYGYAIIRALVARAQVAYGLIPAFGVHHDNDLNAFNLTDDVMEVFRPFVDRMVFSIRESDAFSLGEEKLSKEIRQQLASIGQTPCRFSNEVHTLAHVAEMLAAALVDAIREKNTTTFICPELTQENIVDEI